MITIFWNFVFIVVEVILLAFLMIKLLYNHISELYVNLEVIWFNLMPNLGLI